MAEIQYMPIAPKPGIQRDGTQLDSDQCVDGIWTRFYKGRPMKMGGYQLLQTGNSEIVRNLFSVDSQDSIQLYLGQPSSISTFRVFGDLATTAPFNITPLAFVPNINNSWSITSVAYSDDTPPPNAVYTDYIIATACPNGFDISNNVEENVYWGVIGSSDPLTPLLSGSTIITTAGGVMNLGSFILILGINGFITWNDGLSLDTWPNTNFAQLGTSKFIYGAPVRSGATVGGLIWALDALIGIQYTGSEAPQFALSYVSTRSTLLSQNCVVSFDPYFYWIGRNTFYMYNGAVVELENETNKLWFFSNLNSAYKERVYGFVNKKFNEIWWLFPYGDSTENNWALIYNMSTQAWYDTPLDRSCAVSSNSQMAYPIMASSIPYSLNLSTSYPTWIHEIGLNAVDPVSETAIVASFQTNKIWNKKSVTTIDTFLPDVQIEESMFMQVLTQGYPNSEVTYSPVFSFDGSTEFLTIRVKGSIVSTVFTSNVVDGNYLFGQCTYKVIIGDDQRPGPSTI